MRPSKNQQFAEKKKIRPAQEPKRYPFPAGQEIPQSRKTNRRAQWMHQKRLLRDEGKPGDVRVLGHIHIAQDLNGGPVIFIFPDQIRQKNQERDGPPIQIHGSRNGDARESSAAKERRQTRKAASNACSRFRSLLQARTAATGAGFESERCAGKWRCTASKTAARNIHGKETVHSQETGHTSTAVAASNCA